MSFVNFDKTLTIFSTCAFCTWKLRHNFNPIRDNSHTSERRSNPLAIKSTYFFDKWESDQLNSRSFNAGYPLCNTRNTISISSSCAAFISKLNSIHSRFGLEAFERIDAVIPSIYFYRFSRAIAAAVYAFFFINEFLLLILNPITFY